MYQFAENITFNDMCKTMTSKQFLDEQLSFVNHRELTMHTGDLRTFCSMYLIYFFPEDVFQLPLQMISQNDKCNKCHEAAKSLHLSVSHDSSDMNQNWILFKSRFNEWKMYDHVEIMKSYQNAFSVIQEIKCQNDTNTEIVHSCESLAGTLDKQISKLFNGTEIHEIHTPKKIIVSEELVKNISKNMHDAYWATLTTQLLAREYHELCSIIGLQKQILETLTSKESLKTEINEYLDVQFINQMMTTHCLDPRHLSKLLQFIYETLRNLGCPVDDTHIDSILKKIPEDFVSNKINDQTSYVHMCVSYIRDALERSFKILNITADILQE